MPFRIELGLFPQKARRVHRVIVSKDFVVQVRGGGDAGVAGEGDHFATANFVAGFDEELGVVAVDGFEAVAMVYGKHHAP